MMSTRTAKDSSKMIVQCVFILVVCASSSAWARSASTHVNAVDSGPDDKYFYDTSTTEMEEVAKSVSTGESIWNEFEYVYRTYKECSDLDLSVCLKLKLVRALDGASRSSKNVELIEGIKLVGLDKESQRTRPKTVQSEEELLATLPRSVSGQESALTSMIWDKVSQFFQSHTIQIKFPSAEELQQRSEGRDKDKKHHGYIMIPLLLGSTIIPIAYGALALLAGKALIVSKLALVLASIIGIKKLVSHSGDSGHSSRRYGLGASPDEPNFNNGRGFELPASVVRS